MTAHAGGRVVLVGPPGAGTSTVGRVLAARLGVDLLDTDRTVEARFGAPSAEIFIEHGEAAFREAEREVALQTLEMPETPAAGVVVLGGGSVLDPLVGEALRRSGAPGASPAATVVFLDVTIAHAARRLGLLAERPAGVAAPRSQWLRMMEERRPVYRQLADLSVCTDDLEPEQVAEAVLRGLGAGGPAEQEKA